jgi:hypothetical protein
LLFSLYQHSHSAGPPLRIGLLLDSTELLQCFAEVVDHIRGCDFARVELLVYNAEAMQAAARPPVRQPLLWRVFRLLQNKERRQRLLFTLYERLDQRRIAGSDDPLAMVDCSSRFRGIESISVTPITKRFVHRFPASAIDHIREKQLDVLIRFGFNILRGEILSAAKYGVWSYHHGDNDYYRGGPPYFWELYENNPLSGAVLQQLTEQLDAGKVLCKGQFATVPGISRALNLPRPYWGASTFVIQKLHELHQDGWSHVEQAAINSGPYLGRKQIYTSPSNWEMLCWLGPCLIRKSLRRLVRRPAVKHWRIAVRTGARKLLDSDAKPDMSGFRWIDSAPGHYYADPFLMEAGGKFWLFFEDFNYATKRGTISCAEMQGDSLLNPVTVLERPYHLSYPCVFRDKGVLYMMPETASSGAVELYRCIRFPDRWEFDRDLFKGRAVDSTIWIEGGLYWLFVTLQEPRGRGTQLWLFFAESLTGDWQPHPQSPISTDVRDSRGAGSIFRHQGRLFRPSQDCSRCYGYSFTLREIVALDRNRYREKPAVTVDPSWAPGLVGTHSYSQLGSYEVIDACSTVPAGHCSQLGR